MTEATTRRLLKHLRDETEPSEEATARVRKQILSTLCAHRESRFLLKGLPRGDGEAVERVRQRLDSHREGKRIGVFHWSFVAAPLCVIMFLLVLFWVRGMATSPVKTGNEGPRTYAVPTKPRPGLKRVEPSLGLERMNRSPGRLTSRKSPELSPQSTPKSKSHLAIREVKAFGAVTPHDAQGIVKKLKSVLERCYRRTQTGGLRGRSLEVTLALGASRQPGITVRGSGGTQDGSSRAFESCVRARSSILLENVEPFSGITASPGQQLPVSIVKLRIGRSRP